MNEAQFVEKIRHRMKEKVPNAVILKLQDFNTSGIPDLAITFKGYTHWVEVKILKDHETVSTFKKHIDALQLATCWKLGEHGKCRYLIGYPVAKDLHACLIYPNELRQLREALTTGAFDRLLLSKYASYHSFWKHAVDHLSFLIKET